MIHYIEQMLIGLLYTKTVFDHRIGTALFHEIKNAHHLSDVGLRLWPQKRCHHYYYRFVT